MIGRNQGIQMIEKNDIILFGVQFEQRVLLVQSSFKQRSIECC